MSTTTTTTTTTTTRDRGDRYGPIECINATAVCQTNSTAAMHCTPNAAALISRWTPYRTRTMPSPNSSGLNPVDYRLTWERDGIESGSERPDFEAGSQQVRAASSPSSNKPLNPVVASTIHVLFILIRLC